MDQPVNCRIPALPAEAVIRDVSKDGCRLVMKRSRLEPGWTVSLEVAPRVWAKGEVVWTRNLETGVRFRPSLGGSAAAIALGLEEPEPVIARRSDIRRAETQPSGLRRLFGAIAGHSR